MSCSEAFFTSKFQNNDTAYVFVFNCFRKNCGLYVMRVSCSTVIDSHGMVLYI